MGFYDTPGHVPSVTVSGIYAYVADGDSGLRIIDISTPSAPYEVGFYKTPGSALYVCVSDSLVHMSCFEAGLQIYEFLGTGIEDNPGESTNLPGSLRLIQNPVNGGYIELLLVSPQGHNAEITIYNQLGQKIKTYHLNGLKTGENNVQLDATMLATGVYFLKLDDQLAGKLVRVR